VRTLGIVFGGPPGSTSGTEARLRAFAAAWARSGPVDWVLAARSREASAALAQRWAPATGGRVFTLEPAESVRLSWWRGMQARYREQHEGPRQAPPVAAVLGRLDPTVGRHQMARILGEQPYDIVWCADVVAMALYGKVRRDLPVVLDVPAPMDATARKTDAVPDPGGWHRFEQHVAASAHLVTVPTLAAREVLGVPGTLAVDPASRSDLATLDHAVAEVCRWSNAFHGFPR
jgi:hypothetical protein